MNIIRTKAVELSAIPAIAYKQKLSAGGAGVKLLRLDQNASAVASIDKRSGEAVAYGKTDETLFPFEAFEEAIELLAGAPYSARGKITITPAEQADTEDVAEQTEKISMVESDEYAAIIARYSDEKGKLNYALMNKDFIQFASKSKVISDMISARAANEDILVAVVKNRAAFIAGKKDNLDDTSAKALIETLDEIDPRSAFKELKAHVNRLLAKAK